jgi:hypothetical protein
MAGTIMTDKSRGTKTVQQWRIAWYVNEHEVLDSCFADDWSDVNLMIVKEFNSENPPHHAVVYCGDVHVATFNERVDMPSNKKKLEKYCLNRSKLRIALHMAIKDAYPDLSPGQHEYLVIEYQNRASIECQDRILKKKRNNKRRALKRIMANKASLERGLPNK